jgi:hypothetical protein
MSEEASRIDLYGAMDDVVPNIPCSSMNALYRLEESNENLRVNLSRTSKLVFTSLLYCKLHTKLQAVKNKQKMRTVVSMIAHFKKTPKRPTDKFRIA